MAVEDFREDIDIVAQQNYRERQEFALKIERVQQEHVLQLAKLKTIEQGRVKARARRAQAAERVALALLKLPALVLLALLVPIIILAGREVPEFLQVFFSL